MAIGGVLYVTQKPTRSFRKKNVTVKQREPVTFLEEGAEQREQPQLFSRLTGKEMRLAAFLMQTSGWVV